MADKQNEENERISSLAGMGAGALAGASMGTAVFPVVGTFAGALVGGLLGSQVGRTVGAPILDALNPAQPQPYTPPSAQASPVQPAETEPDVITKLERLSNLHERGLISDAEFAAAKAKLLDL